MKSHFTRFLAAASALVVVGCGSNTVTGMQVKSDGTLQAKASATLRQGFDDIHKAIFDMIDKNKDGNIDEYEAGPYFNLQNEFPRADRGHAGTINYNEFMAYATKGGFLSPNDTPDRFLDRERDFLAGAFKSFDTLPKRGWFDHGDGYLTPRELSHKAVQSAGLGFSYPKLHLDVKIKGFTKEEFKAADKTGDGKLSQGEFEDLYLAKVVSTIGKIGQAKPPHHPGGGGSNPPAPPSNPGGGGNPPAPPSNPGGGGNPPAPPSNPGGGGGHGDTPSTNIYNNGVIVIDSDAWDAWDQLL